MRQYDVCIVGLNAGTALILSKTVQDSTQDVLVLTNYRSDEEVELAGLSLIDYIPHTLLSNRQLAHLRLITLHFLDTRPNVELLTNVDVENLKILAKKGEYSLICSDDKEIKCKDVVIGSEVLYDCVANLISSIEHLENRNSIKIRCEDPFTALELYLLLNHKGFNVYLDNTSRIEGLFEHEIVNMIHLTSSSCDYELSIEFKYVKPKVDKSEHVLHALLGRGFEYRDYASGIMYTCTRDLELIYRASLMYFNNLKGTRFTYLNSILADDVAIFQVGLPRPELSKKYSELSSTRICKDVGSERRLCVRLTSWRGRLLSVHIFGIGKDISTLCERYVDQALRLLDPEVRIGVPLVRISDLLRGGSPHDPLALALTCLRY